MALEERPPIGPDREDGTTPRVSPGSLLVFLSLPAVAGGVLFLVFGPGILVTFAILCVLVAIPIVTTRIFVGPPRKKETP